MSSPALPEISPSPSPEEEDHIARSNNRIIDGVAICPPSSSNTPEVDTTMTEVSASPANELSCKDKLLETRKSFNVQIDLHYDQLIFHPILNRILISSQMFQPSNFPKLRRKRCVNPGNKLLS